MGQEYLYHVLVSGERLEFEAPEGEVGRFFEQIKQACEEDDLSEGDLIAMVYSVDNPLLEPGPVPGRGMVTVEVYNNPLFKVMLDLVEQKRLRDEGTLEDDSHARHTVEVEDAAYELGLSPERIVAAIEARTLTAVRRDERWLIDPASMRSYRVSTRTQPVMGVPLRVRLGVEGPFELLLQHDGELVDELPEEEEDLDDIFGSLVETAEEQTSLIEWTHACALLREGEERRCVYMVVAEEEGRIECGPFYVSGYFHILKDVTDSEEITQLWSEFS